MLQVFYGKKVRVLTPNDKTIVGKVIDYIYAEDDMVESIIIDDTLSGDLIEVGINDIDEIKPIA